MPSCKGETAEVQVRPTEAAALLYLGVVKVKISIFRLHLWVCKSDNMR